MAAAEAHGRAADGAPAPPAPPAPRPDAPPRSRARTEPAPRPAEPDAEAAAEPGAGRAAAQARARNESAGVSTPAPVLVRAALKSTANLDFPQVTEICERLEVEPAELPETVRVLVDALSKHGGSTKSNHLRSKLRALTISNELMYNAQAVDAFRRQPGLPEALQQLRNVRGTELGSVTDENLRMLATEVERRCFEDGARAAGPAASAAAAARDLWETGTFENNLERLERARQKASKVFLFAGKKAEKTMQKAEKTLVRTAESVFQEEDPLLSADHDVDGSVPFFRAAGADAEPAVEGLEALLRLRPAAHDSALAAEDEGALSAAPLVGSGRARLLRR